MGRRAKKLKGKNKRNQQTKQTRVATKPVVTTGSNTRVELENATPVVKTEVTKLPKGDTIRDIDFFGFPASVFQADLRRTGWATLTIVIILVVITLIVRMS